MTPEDFQKMYLEVNKICEPYGIKAQILISEGQSIMAELQGEFPGHEILDKISIEITNKVKEIDRVLWLLDKKNT